MKSEVVLLQVVHTHPHTFLRAYKLCITDVKDKKSLQVILCIALAKSEERSEVVEAFFLLQQEIIMKIIYKHIKCLCEVSGKEGEGGIICVKLKKKKEIMKSGKFFVKNDCT